MDVALRIQNFNCVFKHRYSDIYKSNLATYLIKNNVNTPILKYEIILNQSQIENLGEFSYSLIVTNFFYLITNRLKLKQNCQLILNFNIILKFKKLVHFKYIKIS